MEELYKKYRPKSFKSIVGQPEAVAMLNKMMKSGKMAHTILFSGSSGCGKTTLARILKTKLNCSDSDFCELNCADFRGIEVVREIRARMGLAPMGGKVRIWLIDEAHQLSSDAQNAFLKMLEDTPRHVYFILATTLSQKLLATVRGRCTEIKVKPLNRRDMLGLISAICEQESNELNPKVMDRIADVSEGSPRKALVILNQIMGLETVNEQLNAIMSSDMKHKAFEIAQALMKPGCKWMDIAPIIKDVEDEPEGLRHMILGYASKVMLGGGRLTDRAFLIIQAFRDNWYDCHRAGLIASCYEVVSSKR